ncbi:MAG: hypothetical protein AB7I19_18345 [Planctomycetota bacterium]
MKTILSTIALSSSLLAQGFTSPAGYVTTEGSSNHDYILFKYDDLTWQQLDATSVGQPAAVVQRISWRRDGTAAADPTWTARTMDVEVVLADSVLPGSVSENYSANYLTAPTVVFTSKPVNFPDWTANPGVSPAPWNLALTLDTPWVYTGVNPFLWEVRTRNNASASDYGNDFQSISGSTGASTTGTSIATGCIPTGGSVAMALAGLAKNQFNRFRLAYTVTNAPASTGVFLNLDFVNSNLTLPGLCTTLVAAPTISTPIGSSDPSGAVPQFNLDNIPFNPAVIGSSIFAQALAFDFAQPVFPIVLSNGRSLTFPNTPTTSPADVTRVYGYRLASGTMRAPSVWTGGIVTLLD